MRGGGQTNLSRQSAFRVSNVFSKTCFNFSKSAFTLAEVLITLGIIGIVAAMTLPALVNNAQNKQLETALKKAYSNLGQVIQRVVMEDFGGVLDVDNARNLGPYFVKYYTEGRLCSGYSTDKACPNIGQVNFCDFMKQNYKTYNGHSTPACVGNDAVSNTVDSTTIYFDAAGEAESSATYGRILMAVDVNGWQKKPNRWGHDIFMFELTKAGKLLPMGAEEMSWPEDDFCSRTSSSSNNGYGCTVRALSEKDYFKNLPK